MRNRNWNRKWIFGGISVFVLAWVVRRMLFRSSIDIQAGRQGNAAPDIPEPAPVENNPDPIEGSESDCIQARLFERYARFHAESNLPDDVARKLSAPLLLHVSPKWLTSRPRVLIVGQHTLGWGIDRRYHSDPERRCHSCPYPEVLDFCTWKRLPRKQALAAMDHAYEVFEASENQPAIRNSALWQAFRQISEKTAGDPHGALFTNLFRMDLEDKSPCLDEEGVRKPLSAVQRTLLRDEVRSLRPDAVVFFTGVSKQCPWKYDDEIRAEFPGVVFADFPGHNSRQIALLRHVDLPAKAIRTHHPQVLRLHRQWSYITRIAEWINGHGEKAAAAPGA